MYRPLIRVAYASNSPGSAEVVAVPAIVTKLNGGRSSSQQSDTLG